MYMCTYNNVVHVYIHVLHVYSDVSIIELVISIGQYWSDVQDCHRRLRSL